MMKFLILMTSFLSMFSCSEDHVKEIGYGYAFFTSNKYNHYVIKEKLMVVGSNIVRYEVSGKYMVGFREMPVDPDTIIDDYDKFGYFILNLESGVLVEGLSKEVDIDNIERLSILNAKLLIN